MRILLITGTGCALKSDLRPSTAGWAAHSFRPADWRGPAALLCCAMRMEDLFALAAELGKDRCGVVTAAALRLAGADPDTIRDALCRYWQAPVRGVYLRHRQPPSTAELAHVALAHAGHGSVLTGVLAARAHRLRWVPELPGAMVLVAPHLRRVNSEGKVLVRRCAGLGELVTTAWNGVPIAPVQQVVVDTCRQLLAVRKADLGPRPTLVRRAWFEQWCLRDIRGLVLGAVADKRCTVEELRAVLDAGATRDSALIRRACNDAARGAASPPEAELVDDLLEYGVPFACNVELWDGEILVAVLDAYLIGTGVGAELDSEEAHGETDALDATLQRHKRVKAYGLELCHITPTRYRGSPAAFHAELFAEAKAQLARGAGDPPGLRMVLRGPVLRGPRRADPPYWLPRPPALPAADAA